MALTWWSGEDQTLETQRIHQEFLECLMQFYQGNDEEVADGLSSNPSTCHKGCISKIIWTSLCWGEGINVVDDNTNHRGVSMVFLIMKYWYPGRFHNVDDDHHNCGEISWRCNRSAMTSSQRNDEAKGYWNHGYDTNSKPSLRFKEKWYDEEDRRKLSSSSKIVLREEGPGSTVKI